MSGSVSAANTHCSAPTKGDYLSKGSARRDSNPPGFGTWILPADVVQCVVISGLQPKNATVRVETLVATFRSQ